MANYNEKICKRSGEKWKKYNSFSKCQCKMCKEANTRKPIEFKPKQPIAKVSKTNKVIEKVKSLSDYKADLQKEINSIVRELDKGHNCICNLGKRMKLITAGHLWSVGSNETIRFHLLNIWGQDYDSNGAKGGEPIEFKNGLIELYGFDFFTMNILTLKSIKPINLNIDEVKEKTSIARGILKWLKLQERKFTIAERLELRIKFNSELGIYEN